MKKIIVCGGRNFNKTQFIFDELDKLFKDFDPENLHIITGGARGVDTAALEWADERFVINTMVPANWEKYDKAAGHIRNGLMIRLFSPIDLVVAFPGGTGTTNMIKQATKAGIVIKEIK